MYHDNYIFVFSDRYIPYKKTAGKSSLDFF